MMCFRDMSFCTRWKECKHGDTCERSYTDDVKREAAEWMDNALIAFTAFQKCFEPKGKDDNES